MAITKTTTVQRVEVYPDKRMMVVYNDVFDDPEDDQLPHESQRVVQLYQTTTYTENGGSVTETPTDVSRHDPLVQTIAAAIWTD
jgi:hypothetical protein